ncbi:hypothetical protein D3C76_1363320 [compost metagenome]
MIRFNGLPSLSFIFLSSTYPLTLVNVINPAFTAGNEASIAFSKSSYEVAPVIAVALSLITFNILVFSLAVAILVKLLLTKPSISTSASSINSEVKD